MRGGRQQCNVMEAADEMTYLRFLGWWTSYVCAVGEYVEGRLGKFRIMNE